QLEAMGMSMAFVACTAGIEALVAAGVLFVGAGGLIHALCLLAWIGGIILLARLYYRRMQEWGNHYRLMTCDLVERMAGHRTRLAQELPDNRHVDEDRELDRYLAVSKKLDNIQVLMESVAGGRGWIPMSLLGILLLFFTSGMGIAPLAVSLGGTLLASLSLDQLTQSLHHFLEAMMSWHQVRPLYQAASRGCTGEKTSFISPVFLQQQAVNNPIIRAEDLVFSYRTGERGQRKILDQCDLLVESGQHILLEGPSGGGKSTLASILSGLEVPDTGTLLLFGLPYEVLGEEDWRKRIVIAPQFHQNYVLSETFAFNLLMGRAWPPTHEDLLEAEEICQDLGLGELLETMPAGLQQMVGESGWRLSHGEQSRLFIARTLLQGADLIILDESFAALDPETLTVALTCVLRRASALLLIAHP
ncbi:MAG: ATP-binding cassette domain-containing protein, partial [Candidatus Electrothrix sp. AUS4]|nr:ATP-binding cassette domain-containing protein [Candidatus Electrothrix sp. AUS4]